MPRIHGRPAQAYALWLWLLLGLFGVRVIAQPMARLTDSRFLPPFDAWHSGVLPYPVLLASQLLIVVWLARTARTFSTGEVVASRRLGVASVALGGVYFVLMVARLILGATVLHQQRWFASPLPTVFHLVLASYLLVFGHFHYRHGSDTGAG